MAWAQIAKISFFGVILMIFAYRTSACDATRLKLIVNEAWSSKRQKTNKLPRGRVGLGHQNNDQT